MKIVQQTQDELVLTEGGAKGVIIGAVFAIIGAVLAVSGQWLIGGILFVVGLGVVLLGSTITININKTSGQLGYQKKRLIGGSTASYATADIIRIETRKQWQTSTTNNGANRGFSTQQQLVSQSVIVFKDGTELPLDHQSSSPSVLGAGVLLGGTGKESAVAKQVADFLGVPFQEIAPPAQMGMGIGGIQL